MMKLPKWSLLLFLAMFIVCPQKLLAQTFTLPGQVSSLPAWWGCSAAGSIVTCTGYSDWTNVRNIAVSTPVTLRLNAGAMNGANVNVGGNAANLTIELINNTSLSVGSDSHIVANIVAGNVYATGSNIIMTGNHVIQGQMSIGANAQVSGTVTAGSIGIGSNSTLTGNLSATNTLTLGSGSTANGNLSGGTININNNATANGNLSATGNVNLSQDSTVNGTITAGGNLNANTTGIQIQGDISVTGNANLGPGIQVIGEVDAIGDINMNSNGYIDGNVSGNNINIGNSAVIDGSVDSNGQVSNQGTINGNVNSTGPVYTDNGTVTGYVNAPNAEQVANTGNVGGPVCDQNSNEGPCSGGGSGVQFYHIEHSGSALTCEAASIIVRACADLACVGGVDLTGAVAVRASGITEYVSTGSFGNSAAAGLSLPITTPGTYTLSLDSVPVAASDPVQCTGGCQLTAVDAALFWQDIPTQTAGSPFQVQLDAVRADTNTGACVAAVQGLTQIDVSVTCLDPDSCFDDGVLLSAESSPASEFPAYTAVPVQFDNSGSAVLEMDYADAGRIRLHARADIGQLVLSGVSAEFVVRPATIGIDVTNPVTYTTGVFARAGDDLQVELSALTSTGHITPNFGKENQPAALTLSTLGNAVVPEDGTDGSVQILQPFTWLDDGIFSSSQIRYTEVGTAVFTAHAVGMDYLGTGNLTAQSDATGRFLPWQFHVDNAWVEPACNVMDDIFTYMDQPFVMTVNLSARNRDQQLTLNYPDTATPAVLRLQARDAAADLVLSSRLSPSAHVPVWAQGLGILSAAEVTLTKLPDNDVDGPFESVSLAIRVDDGLEEGPHVPMADSDFREADRDCTVDCDAVLFNEEFRFIYGEMVLADTYGPETESVEVALLAYFWDGERFRRNTADQCTSTEPDNLEIILNTDGLVTIPSGYPGQLSNGRSLYGSLLWTAPGAPGFIRFMFLAPEWLKSESADDNNPSATAEFGQYGGHDRVIHWQDMH
ncbi:MAG: hypothetical protein Q7W55_15640 [Pseudohongiella sp.]|nr:hypothetical protein [Pseudohongiella sp.]